MYPNYTELSAFLRRTGVKDKEITERIIKLEDKRRLDKWIQEKYGVWIKWKKKKDTNIQMV